MTLKNQRELENTRKKLRLLERLYVESSADTDGNPEVRDAELESYRRLINQLKEEIARYEARQPTQRDAARP